MTTIGVLVSGAELQSPTDARDAEFVSRSLEPLGDLAPGSASGDWRELSGVLRPDIVFHTAHSAATVADRLRSAWTLEETGIPFSGSSAEAIALTGKRRAVKDKLGAAEVATAAYSLVETIAELEPLRRRSYPLAIFALNPERPTEDYLIADSAADLERIAASLWQKDSTPFLVERHLQGATFCCVVLGNHPNRMVFPPVSLAAGATTSPDGRPWVDSLPDGLQHGVERVALAAAHALGLRDLGRIDVALSDAGVPHVVAVDALPCLTPGETNPVALAAEATDLDVADMVRLYLMAAAKRTGVFLRQTPGVGDARQKTPPRGLRRRRA